MKKNAVSLLSIIIASVSVCLAENPNAIFLHEGFNGTGIPSGWTQYRISGSTAQWSVVGVGSNPNVPPYAGAGQAKFNSFDASSGEQARLVSPSINLSAATDPFLTFYLYHDNEYLLSRDSLYVDVSTNDSVTGPWTTVLGTTRPKVIEGWTKELVSLFPYRGASRVFLSFRGVSKYGNNMFVDEFRVADSAFHDIGVTELSPEIVPLEPPASAFTTTTPSVSRSSLYEGGKAGVSGGSQPAIVTFPFSQEINIRGIVANRGTFTESSYAVNWQIDGVQQPQTQGGSIEPRTGRDTVDLTWNNPTPGIHTLAAWTVLPSDSNRANDTCRISFQVLEAGTVMYESFNNAMFPPAGWVVVNRDGGILSPWFRGADTSAFPAFEGSGFAANNFQRSNGAYLDDYLITPQVIGVGQPGLVDSLVFWTRSQFNQPPAANFPDSLMVLISTSGTDTSNFTILLDYFAVPKTGWVRKGYALSSYVPANSAVRIAFRYLLYDVQATTGSGDFVGIDAVQFIRRVPASATGQNLIPEKFVLRQNFPNPFNPSTIIAFELPEAGTVELKVFDIVGREVAVLVNSILTNGLHQTVFEAANLPTGIYFYRLKYSGHQATRHMILLR